MPKRFFASCSYPDINFSEKGNVWSFTYKSQNNTLYNITYNIVELL